MNETSSEGTTRATRKFDYGPRVRTAKRRLICLPQLSPTWSAALHFVAPLFIILLLIGGGLLAVRGYYARELGLSEARDARYRLFALGAENVEADLLDKYIRAQGGVKALKQLNRLTFRGSIFESGHQYIFKGKKECGGQRQCTLTDRSSGISLKLEGDRLVSGDVVVPVDSRLLSMVSLIGEFYDPFADLIMTRRGRIIKVEEVAWKGIPAFRVRFDRPHLGIQTDIYLSGDNLSALERIDIHPGGLKRSYRYSNYQYVNGFRFPFTIYVDGGGSQLSRIHFSRIDREIGEGLLDTDFLTAYLR